MILYACGKPGEIPLYSANKSLISLGDGQVIIEVGERMPLEEMTISADGTSLVPIPADLSDLKTQRWTLAKQCRDDRAGGDCMTRFGRVDTDADSQRKINGAVTAALVQKTLGQPFEVDWTMHDNSVETLDADKMIEVGLTVVSFVAACQSAGTVIRDAILSATTVDALAAIDITAGYPT